MNNPKEILKNVYNAVAGAVGRAIEEGPFTAPINWMEGLPRKSKQQPKQQPDNTPKH
jgi:hypothetical protein